jgi:hypothetical protein
MKVPLLQISTKLNSFVLTSTKKCIRFILGLLALVSVSFNNELILNAIAFPAWPSYGEKREKNVNFMILKTHGRDYAKPAGFARITSLVENVNRLGPQKTQLVIRQFNV